MGRLSRGTTILVVATLLAAATGACDARRPVAPQAPGTATETNAPAPGAGSRHARLAAVRSWAFAIADPALEGSTRDIARRLGVFDLVVIDGEEATAEQVAAIQSEGALVLGYLSVGTIEPWRSWYPDLERYALAGWDRWDEYYADVAAPGFRDAIVERIAPSILAKGFDGLFLDNIDAPAAYPEMAPDMYALVDALSLLAHGQDALLFAQNGDDVFDGSFWELLDGWNREDVTWTYDDDASTYVRVPAGEHDRLVGLLRHFRSTGLVTLTCDYTALGNGREEAECVAASLSAGALPYVSDITLARIPAAPLAEPGP